MAVQDLPTGLLIAGTALFAAFSALFLLRWAAGLPPGRAAPRSPAANAEAGTLSPENSSGAPPLRPPVPASSGGHAGDPARPGVDDLFLSRQLAEMLDASPCLAWRQDDRGRVTWANRPYRRLARRLGHDPESALQPLFPAGATGTGAHRLPLTLPGADRPQWFEVQTLPAKGPGSLHFATPADAIIRAEEALRNFVQTLTLTFAHLPIGLAIFDSDRRLALFNPALADLTALPPDWLTARPSLHAFLDRLRENRHLPEPRDYKSWRERFADLERAAENGTYEETWSLPDGRTYRVTGRPHPEGAVAFLFDDVTAAITLKRQFRSELELGQSVIDAMPDALAVFSADGELVLTNAAFAALWGTDPREMLAAMTVTETVALWRDQCRPDPIWGDLADSLASGRERVAWGGRVRHLDGRELELSVQPLARGATLCRFADCGGAGAPASGEDDAPGLPDRAAAGGG